MAEFQTISSAIDIADRIYTAIQRYRNAHQVLEEIRDNAEQVKALLQFLDETLQASDKAQQTEKSTNDYDRGRALVVWNINACHKQLKNSFGLRDGDGSVDSIKQRLKTAMKENTIQQDQNNLDRILARLHTCISVMNLRLNSERIIDGRRSGQPSQTVLDEYRHSALKGIKDWPKTTDDVQFSAEEYDGDADLYSMATLKNELFRPYYWNTIAPTSNSSTYGSLNEPDFAADPFAQRRADSSTSESLETGLDTPDTDEYDPNERQEAVIPPKDILDAFILKAQQAADHHLENGRWTRAEKDLRMVFHVSGLREKAYRASFDNRRAILLDLATVYLREGRWEDAMENCVLMRLRSPSKLEEDSSGMSDNESHLTAKCYLLRGTISFDRYSNGYVDAESKHRNSTDRNQDLNEAERMGMAALKVFEKIKNSASGQSEHIPQYCLCHRLLFRVYEACNEPHQAQYFKEQLEQYCKDVCTQRSWRDASISMVIGDFNPNDSRQNLPPERLTNVSSDASEDLLDAVEKGDMLTLTRSINSGNVELNTRTADGGSILNTAVATRNADVVDLLLDHGANPNTIDDNDQTPLLICVGESYSDIAEILIERGADVQAVDEDKWTLLHHAVHNESTKMTEFLLQKAPELRDARDRYGKTPLHHCAINAEKKQMYRQAEMLLRHNADVNAEIHPDDPRTPVILVGSQTATPGRNKMVELLVKTYKAKIDPARLPSNCDGFECLRPYARKNSTR